MALLLAHSRRGLIVGTLKLCSAFVLLDDFVMRVVVDQPTDVDYFAKKNESKNFELASKLAQTARFPLPCQHEGTAMLALLPVARNLAAEEGPRKLDLVQRVPPLLLHPYPAV